MSNIAYVLWKMVATNNYVLFCVSSRIHHNNRIHPVKEECTK